MLHRKSGIPPVIVEHTQLHQQGTHTNEDDDNKMQVDYFKKFQRNGKGKHPDQRGIRTGNTDVNICKELWYVRRLGERRLLGTKLEKRTATPAIMHARGKNNRNGKGKGKQVDMMHTNHSSNSFTSCTDTEQ